MFSHGLQFALEREVVGQRRAIRAMVRALSIALSGLHDREGPLGIYLIVGPRGTGKSHLARSLARWIHGPVAQPAVADCVRLGGGDEWLAVARQLAPHFRPSLAHPGDAIVGMAPLSVLLVDHLEAARPEFARALVTAMASGCVPLPDGKSGSLRGCLILLASKLCAREIFEAEPREIGFSTASEDLEESEKGRIYRICLAAAEKHWGSELLGQLDDLIVFHRLQEDHLPFIVRRLVLELNRKLAALRLECELDLPATDFVVERGARSLEHGATGLVRAFRRFVEFPVADLVSSGRVGPGTRLLVERDDSRRLRFSVSAGGHRRLPTVMGVGRPVAVPID